MTLLQKILGLLILIVGSVTVGYYYGKGDKEIVVQEKVVTQEGATQIVYRDRIVTVTKEVKPDGTTTETTKVEEKDKTVDRTEKSTDVARESTSTPVLARYSVGMSVQSPYNNLLPKYGVTAGYRALGPVWVEAGGTTDRQVILGVRVEL